MFHAFDAFFSWKKQNDIQKVTTYVPKKAESESWGREIVSGWGISTLLFSGHVLSHSKPVVCLSIIRSLNRTLSPIYWPSQRIIFKPFHTDETLSSIGGRNPSLEGDSITFLINSFQYLPSFASCRETYFSCHRNIRIYPLWICWTQTSLCSQPS